MALSSGSKYGRATDNSAVVLSGFSELIRAVGSIEDGADLEARRRVAEVGRRVALVAAANAPRRTGELQHSVKSSVAGSSASIYSTAVYGGAVNFGAWTKFGRGPHITRAGASHYMDKAVKETSPWVAERMDGLLDWVTRKFEEAG